MNTKNVTKIMYLQDFSSVNLKGKLQTMKERPDASAKIHSVTVTERQYVGCANELRGRKFAYLEQNFPLHPSTLIFHIFLLQNSICL